MMSDYPSCPFKEYCSSREGDYPQKSCNNREIYESCKVFLSHQRGLEYIQQRNIEEFLDTNMVRLED